jgi:hypothetical protein
MSGIIFETGAAVLHHASLYASKGRTVPLPTSRTCPTAVCAIQKAFAGFTC